MTVKNKRNITKKAKFFIDENGKKSRIRSKCISSCYS